MKKLLLLSALLAIAPLTANASCAPVLAAGAAPVGIVAISTTLLPAVLFATIALNTPFPLCEVEGVTCAGSYPKQHDAQREEITQEVRPAATGKRYHVISSYGTDSIRSDGF